MERLEHARDAALACRQHNGMAKVVHIVLGSGVCKLANVKPEDIPRVIAELRGCRVVNVKFKAAV